MADNTVKFDKIPGCFIVSQVCSAMHFLKDV